MIHTSYLSCLLSSLGLIYNLTTITPQLLKVFGLLKVNTCPETVSKLYMFPNILERKGALVFSYLCNLLLV